MATTGNSFPVIVSDGKLGQAGHLVFLNVSQKIYCEHRYICMHFYSWPNHQNLQAKLGIYPAAHFCYHITNVSSGPICEKGNFFVKAYSRIAKHFTSAQKGEFYFYFFSPKVLHMRKQTSTFCPCLTKSKKVTSSLTKKDRIFQNRIQAGHPPCISKNLYVTYLYQHINSTKICSYFRAVKCISIGLSHTHF